MIRACLRSLPLLLFALLCACATPRGGSRAPSDRTVITREEMQSSGYANAYMVVEALRPQWLKMRGTSSIYQVESIKVYLDGLLLGGPEYLKQIMTSSIATMSHLDGLAASQRWGLDHGQGAIVVSTRLR
jgi:hypothetical protein